MSGLQMMNHMQCETPNPQSFTSMAVSHDGKILVGHSPVFTGITLNENDTHLFLWGTADGRLLNTIHFGTGRLTGLYCNAYFGQIIACTDAMVRTHDFLPESKWQTVTQYGTMIEVSHYIDGILYYETASGIFTAVKMEYEHTSRPLVGRQGITDIDGKTIAADSTCLAVSDNADCVAIGTCDGILISYHDHTEKNLPKRFVHVEHRAASSDVTCAVWLPNRRLLYGTYSGLYCVHVGKEMNFTKFDDIDEVSRITVINGNTFAIVRGVARRLVDYYDMDKHGAITKIFSAQFKNPVETLLSFGDGRHIATNTNCDYRTTSVNPAIIDFGAPNLGREMESRIFNPLPV